MAVQYQSKGYGKFFATALMIFYSYYIPMILKQQIWETDLINFFPVKSTIAIMFILSHSPINIILNVMFYFIYALKIPFFERYRINPDKQWPWEEDNTQWRNDLWKTLKALGFIHLIVIPLVLTFEFYTDQPKFRMDLESFPSSFEIMGQIIFLMLLEDFYFYWGHRILHQPFFYKRIHKVHHEFKYPISLGAEYAHPLEFIFTNMIPVSIGYKILGSSIHIVTIFLWVIFRVSEAVDGHCGYEFSWSPYRFLPCSGSASFHDFHHTNNVGNYGSFFCFWDTVMNTKECYEKFKQDQSLKTKKVQ